MIRTRLITLISKHLRLLTFFSITEKFTFLSFIEAIHAKLFLRNISYYAESTDLCSFVATDAREQHTKTKAPTTQTNR